MCRMGGLNILQLANLNLCQSPPSPKTTTPPPPRQFLFATFNLCQSVVPPSICLPQIAIPPIFFCRYTQHIKMTTKDCGIVGLIKSNAIGREGKLRLRSNISPSFAPPSPSKLHPWPISLSQRSNHMQYHSLNFHSKPPPPCRLLQNRTHVKIVKLAIRCQSLKFVRRQ